MIRPRPRRYRGVLYRSTLEADWAATLHHLGVNAEYEAEAYRTPLGIYSPDFCLSAQRVWLEAKGPHDERVDKAEAFANLLAVAHEQDGVINHVGNFLYPISPKQWILVYGRPSKDGLAQLEPSAYFGARAFFARCPNCEHYSVTVDAWNTCRICFATHDRLHLSAEVKFRRARDDV